MTVNHSYLLDYRDVKRVGAFTRLPARNWNLQKVPAVEWFGLAGLVVENGNAEVRTSYDGTTWSDDFVFLTRTRHSRDGREQKFLCRALEDLFHDNEWYAGLYVSACQKMYGGYEVGRRHQIIAETEGRGL